MSALVATFTIDGLQVTGPHDVLQVSGETPNDFTSPVTYKVWAGDHFTNVDYVVTAWRGRRLHRHHRRAPRRR